MKVDAVAFRGVVDVEQDARQAEEHDYDGLWFSETNHDPFLLCQRATSVTSRVEIGTAIAVAFARNPMTLAQVGHDLARASQGRFVLGLGSQVRPHIERRFSMPWSHPAPRMREMILAMRAIWACWQDETPLDFTGEFYRHTLMTPFFTPEPHPFGPPPVYLAAVGEHMTAVAGEVADGMLFHSFTTERYLREVTLPRLAVGLQRAGRGRSGLVLAGPAMVTTATDEQGMAEAVRGTRQQIAFYASTPTYRPVLELHGWGELQRELNRLSRAGEWEAMGERVPDEVLHAVSVVGTPQEAGAELARRYGDVVDRLSFLTPYECAPQTLHALKDALRAENAG